MFLRRRKTCFLTLKLLLIPSTPLVLNLRFRPYSGLTRLFNAFGTETEMKRLKSVMSNISFY